MIPLIKRLIKLEDLLCFTFFISKHFYLGDFFHFLIEVLPDTVCNLQCVIYGPSPASFEIHRNLCID